MAKGQKVRNPQFSAVVSTLTSDVRFSAVRKSLNKVKWSRSDPKEEEK